jgi:hypothetical protein
MLRLSSIEHYLLKVQCVGTHFETIMNILLIFLYDKTKVFFILVNQLL